MHVSTLLAKLDMYMIDLDANVEEIARYREVTILKCIQE
jgi:hypothetical protein